MTQFVYASTKDRNPSAGNCEFEFFNKTFIIIRAPKSNVFKDEYLYFSIYADQNSKIRAIFTVPYSENPLNGKERTMQISKSVDVLKVFELYEVKSKHDEGKNQIGKLETSFGG